MKRLFLFIAAMFAAAVAFGQTPLPNDPAVRVGTLENAEIIKAVDDCRNTVVNFSLFICIFNSQVSNAACCLRCEHVNKSAEKTADMEIACGRGGKPCYSCTLCKTSFRVKLLIIIRSFINMGKQKLSKFFVIQKNTSSLFIIIPYYYDRKFYKYQEKMLIFF